MSGAHGGRGGNADGTFLTSTASTTYGNFSSPLEFGSGGSGQCAGTGGGIVHIEAIMSLENNGIISADGGVSTVSCGGGSGGSILIETDSLLGSGIIRAVGGNGNGMGGGGGGGRASVLHRISTYTGLFLAYGGRSGIKQFIQL